MGSLALYVLLLVFCPLSVVIDILILRKVAVGVVTMLYGVCHLLFLSGILVLVGGGFGSRG